MTVMELQRNVLMIMLISWETYNDEIKVPIFFHRVGTLWTIMLFVSASIVANPAPKIWIC